MRDYKDGSGLQFISFDFLTVGQEIMGISGSAQGALRVL